MSTIERDSAVNEHTQNIRAGLITLKTKYGLHVDEYDYLDMSVDILRDIRNYGTAEYYAVVNADKEGNFKVPCNLTTIDAITATKQGLKQFKDRIEYKVENSYADDSYYTAKKISEYLEYDSFRPGLTRGNEKDGYISYHVKDNDIVMLGEYYANKSAVIAFTGISVDTEGYPMINRKQANALAANAGKFYILKNALHGNSKIAPLLEFFIKEAARLIQGASIPENITDNELETLMDAKVTFNRKTFGRPTKYSR